MRVLTIDARHKKEDYAKVAKDAVAKDGVVLISWQHEDIPLLTDNGQPGISQCILTETGTSGTLGIPSSYPTGPNGARYDLVWVFDRPTGTGPITCFSFFAQMLLPGDTAAPGWRKPRLAGEVDAERAGEGGATIPSV